MQDETVYLVQNNNLHKEQEGSFLLYGGDPDEVQSFTWSFVYLLDRN